MKIKSACSCNNIEFNISHTPNEVAVCHCSLCKKIHKKNSTKFIKCDLGNIRFKIFNCEKECVFTELLLNNNIVDIIKSSERAMRLACSKCKDILFMYYYSSNKIWIVADKLDSVINNIDYYDIYKD
ncbi:aldehyde-activating protein [Tupanvirus soda lake]|uniref:Aldehyde-activating protein n=2 Tax=Tupanvirus TaxID=2094720 RepID=A0A6N1NVJ8_9VIRU|nr:aldehyde-activating protein [Tupanvirus soda lake]QKU35466.1 aldehyde-activating protein [Tupanvirus soda lake]